MNTAVKNISYLFLYKLVDKSKSIICFSKESYCILKLKKYLKVYIYLIKYNKNMIYL